MNSIPPAVDVHVKCRRDPYSAYHPPLSSRRRGSLIPPEFKSGRVRGINKNRTLDTRFPRSSLIYRYLVELSIGTDGDELTYKWPARNSDPITGQRFLTPSPSLRARFSTFPNFNLIFFRINHYFHFARAERKLYTLY